MARLMRLDERVAVVTGGGQGIGEAICQRLAEAGCTVVIADRDILSAKRCAGELCDRYGTRALGFGLDVTDELMVHRCAESVVADFGRLDIWVNNAGIFPSLDAVDVTGAQFQMVFAVNVLGAQFGMASAIQQMRLGGRGGVVVNIASTAAFRGAGAYSASKWAVRGLTHGIAPVVGRDGIRVVAIAPTVTSTPGMSDLLAHGNTDDDVAVRTGAAIPLGRMGEPDDVGRMVAFVVSDAAAFLTGVTIPIDGGSLTVLS